MARAYERLQKPFEARRAYKKAAKLDPVQLRQRSAERLGNVGDALGDMAKYADAVKPYDDAIALHAHVPQVGDPDGKSMLYLLIRRARRCSVRCTI